MGLLDRLKELIPRTAAQSAVHTTEPVISTTMLESLTASKNVGDISAGSLFLNDVLEALKPTAAGKFNLTPNRPSSGKQKDYLVGIRISSVDDVYDGRAVYNESASSVNFNLAFNQGAVGDVRDRVGAAVYPLFGLVYPPPVVEAQAHETPRT